MFYQTFLSPQVKRYVIITYKHGIYELPHEFSSGLRKTLEKKKLNFSSSALIRMKTRVSPKYFANDCRSRSLSDFFPLTFEKILLANFSSVNASLRT